MSAPWNNRWVRANLLMDASDADWTTSAFGGYRELPKAVAFFWSSEWLRPSFANAASLMLDGAPCEDLP